MWDRNLYFPSEFDNAVFHEPSQQDQYDEYILYSHVFTLDSPLSPFPEIAYDLMP